MKWEGGRGKTCRRGCVRRLWIGTSCNNRKIFHGRCFNHDSWASKPLNSSQSDLLGSEDKTMTALYDQSVQEGDGIKLLFFKLLHFFIVSQSLWEQVCVRGDSSAEGGQVMQASDIRTKARLICSFDITLYSWAMIIAISLQRVTEQIAAIQMWQYAAYPSAAGAAGHTHTHFYNNLSSDCAHWQC